MATATRKRLFAGVYPTGIVYCDRWTEEGGDYRRIAYLPYSTLVLEEESSVPPELMQLVREDAAKLIERRGEDFQISTCGQTVRLGQ